MVLRQVIRFLLVEGRLEDAQRRYRLEDEEIEILAAGDPSGNNKYLMWMAGESSGYLNLDPDGWEEFTDDLIKAVQQFHKNQKRLKKKDINQYENLEELESALTRLPVSKRQKEKTTKAENAVVLYEDDDYLLIHPKNREAVCLYGAGTKWCITSKTDIDHYETYLMEGRVFYFFIDKTTSEKLSFVYDSVDNQLESVWNTQNQKIDPLRVLDEEFLNEIMGIIEQDAPNRRLNGPIKWSNGSIRWYLNGKLHREDGPATEYADGSKEWYLNDVLHREDGPAQEFANGSKYWYLNGKRHREDGPAVEWAGGSKEWWLNGIRLTEEKFEQQKIKKGLNDDIF